MRYTGDFFNVFHRRVKPVSGAASRVPAVSQPLLDNPAGTPATPHLRRVLSRRDLVLYGLVILTPTAPYPVFGIVQQLSGGHAALCYVIAMVAMFFTAASYGKMAAAFPSAGSTYTYAQRALNAHVGFLAGWAMILDYFLIPLLSVLYASLTAERLLPQVPGWIWAAAFTLAITWVNLCGIRVTARASAWLMAIMTGCALLFAVLAVLYIVQAQGWPGLLAWHGLVRPNSFAAGPLLLGAGVATLSYIGFDAISTLAEDTLDPRRDIGWATVAVCVIQGLICVATVYLAALVWPDFQAFPQPDTAILDIGSRIGGGWMFGALTVVLLVAGLASALTGQAGASRLLLGMGRDGVLPRRIFARLDSRHATPAGGLYFMAAVSLAGAMLFRFQLAVELLNFGALVGFILVNLSVIRHYYFRLRQRAGWQLATHLCSPLLGTLVCGFLWLNLTAKAKLAGFGWLAVGLLYLAVLTGGFRRPPVVLGGLSEVETDAG